MTPPHAPADQPIAHVVVLVQGKNHTTDNYFRSMAAYGANIATGWPDAPNPPAKDQPHDRHAYHRWLTKTITGTRLAVRHRRRIAVLRVDGRPVALSWGKTTASGFGTNSPPTTC